MEVVVEAAVEAAAEVASTAGNSGMSRLFIDEDGAGSPTKTPGDLYQQNRLIPPTKSTNEFHQRISPTNFRDFLVSLTPCPRRGFAGEARAEDSRVRAAALTILDHLHRIAAKSPSLKNESKKKKKTR